MLETRQTQVAFQTELENSDQFGVRLSDSYELLHEPFSPSGGERCRSRSAATASPDVRLTYALGPRRPLTGSVEVASGGYFGGRLTSVDLNRGRVDLSSRVSIEPSLSLNWIELPAGSFRTDLLRGRVTYTFTPRTFASGLLQYNSTTRTLGANLRLRWEYSPGSELFVVYTEEQEVDPLRPSRSLALRNRAFVVKINRLFRY